MSAVAYYVMASGRGSQPGTGVMLIAAESRVQAHALAAESHRKERGLASNIHIDTYVLCQEIEEADAALFMTKLLFEMDSKEAQDEHIHALDQNRPDTKE